MMGKRSHTVGDTGSGHCLGRPEAASVGFVVLQYRNTKVKSDIKCNNAALVHAGQH